MRQGPVSAPSGSPPPIHRFVLTLALALGVFACDSRSRNAKKDEGERRRARHPATDSPLSLEVKASVSSDGAAPLAQAVLRCPSAAQSTLLQARELWLLDAPAFSNDELATAVSLQGLSAKTHPRIWLRQSGLSSMVPVQLAREGWQLHEVASLDALLAEFSNAFSGLILYQNGDDSLNVATSLSGPLGGIVMEEQLAARLVPRLGLQVLVDTRSLDLSTVLAKHGALLARHIWAEQHPGHVYQLRDLLAMHNIFTFYNPDASLRESYVRELGPGGLSLGWGAGEYEWIGTLSRAGIAALPSDHSLNLSLLSCLPPPLEHRRPLPSRRPNETEGEGGPERSEISAEDEEASEGSSEDSDQRLVAFVMTDGDNIQWLASHSFLEGPHFWASPERGKFPMSWELSPYLSVLAPRALNYIYSSAHPHEDFVAGASGAGYLFPSQNPLLAEHLEQTAALMQASQLSIVSVLDDQGFPARARPFLERPEIDAVLYKDFSRYNRFGSEVVWQAGKPIISYRFLLWESLGETPTRLARAIAAMPARHRSDLQSYALVAVHAWSFAAQGGPLAAVAATIAQLPPQTRVVTVGELVEKLRHYFANSPP